MSGAKIPTGAAVGVIVAIVLVVLFFGWRAVSGGGAPREGDTVKVDVNKVKENMKTDGFGGH